MANIERVSVSETRQRVSSGESLLVCAYEGEDKFKAMHLEGAISLGEFQSKIPMISKESEIIFYCA